jgi:prepilin-type processing-associated H-X9-DG protein
MIPLKQSAHRVSVRRFPQGHNGFTCLDLLVTCVALLLCAFIVLPAVGRTHNNNAVARCMNNLRQLTVGWSMYSPDNAGKIVWSWTYAASGISPRTTNSWCRGNASTASDPGNYYYSSADPYGIEKGDLWPYVQSLMPYRCPADTRVQTSSGTSNAVPSAAFKGQPVTRSYAVNSYMAGVSFVGASYVYGMYKDPDGGEGSYRLITREAQLSRPSKLFVFIEEDVATLDDTMFLISVPNNKWYEIPSRRHFNSYPISFADGHVEMYNLVRTRISAGDNASGADWAALTNVANAY